VLRELSLHAMKYPDSVSGSRKGEELGFFIEHIESEALCRSLVSS